MYELTQNELYSINGGDIWDVGMKLGLSLIVVGVAPMLTPVAVPIIWAGYDLLKL